VSSNISQSYPAGSETEPQRAAAIAKALAANEALKDTLAAETTPLGAVEPADHGAPARWWIWVCPNPKDEARGRLHVAGYARDKHALFTVCDTCGKTYLR
jgi:hypothetical protein